MVSISAGAEDGGFECTGEVSCVGTSSMFEASRNVSLAGAAEGGCSVSIVARGSTLAAGQARYDPRSVGKIFLKRSGEVQV